MKRTVLFDRHKKLNAKIVNFAGYMMPISYSSVNEEHIGELIQLSPNYIGFRGAFCENIKSRESSISLKNVENIVNLIKKPQAVYASA